MTTITEADVEQAALGWQVAHGPDVAPDTPSAERGDYGQVVLERRLLPHSLTTHITRAIHDEPER